MHHGIVDIWMTAMWLSLAFSVTCTINLQTPLLFTVLIGLCSNIHGQTLCKGMSGSSVFTLSAEIFNCHVHWHSHVVIPDRHLCRSLWQWAGHWSDHEPLLRGRSLTQAHCSRGRRPTYCAFGHPLVLPYCCRQSNGPKARPRVPSRPWQSFRNCTCHGQKHYAKWH